jgi:hypothetical protein
MLTTEITVLESIVDRIGLKATLGLLCNVCEAKAEYLQSNWQDGLASQASKIWRKDAVTLDNVKVHAS